MRNLSKKILTSFILLTITLSCFSQWSITPIKRIKLNKRGITYGQYSGITAINDTTFALVHDKSDSIFFISIDNDFNVRYKGATKFDINGRDPEGIAYLHSAGTLFISGEEDQRVIEYNLEGERTGRELNIPKDFRPENRRRNAGFEALTYNKNTHRFWCTTEQGLKSDSINIHRILCFDDVSLQPLSEGVTYCTESFDEQKCIKMRKKGKYANGISDILALDDNTLIVMERELFIPKKNVGGWCTIRLYHFNPTNRDKKLLHEFTTHIYYTNLDFANYEGITLGPKINGDTQTIMIINDSQGGAGNKLFKLKDYLKVYAITKESQP